jgi:hypothetical protein
VASLQHGILQHEAPGTGGEQGAETAPSWGGGHNLADECGLETTGIVSVLEHNVNLLSVLELGGTRCRGRSGSLTVHLRVPLEASQWEAKKFNLKKKIFLHTKRDARKSVS